MTKGRRTPARMIGAKNPAMGDAVSALDPSQVPVAVEYAPTAFVGAAEAVDQTATGLPWYVLVGVGAVVGWFAYSWWHGGSSTKVIVAEKHDKDDEEGE